MKKVKALLVALIGIAFVLPVQAQFQPSSSPPVVFLPAAKTFTTSGSALQTVNGMVSAQITLTGTYSALSLNIQCSTDGATFTSLILAPAAGGATSTTLTANGTYYLNIVGCTSLKYLVNSITGTSVTVKLNATSSPSVNLALQNPASLGDPCLSPFVTKSFVSVAITTATTTQLVALTSGQKIYPCMFQASVGATTTVQFEYGTGSTCGTGTTVMTGVFAPSTGTILRVEDLSPTAVSNAYCLVSTGTGGIQGVLTYIQQ